MIDPPSKGSSPQSSKGGSPNHDSLRSPFARKFLWTQESHPDSPLAHAPRHRRVCAECTSRAHSDGKVHQSAADIGPPDMPRSHSEPLPESAKPLLHWAKRPLAPVVLERANSLEELQAGLAQARSGNNRIFAHRHLKAVAHALIATISMRPPRDLPRGVTNDDVTMLAWEHTERLALGRQRAGSVEAVAPPPRVVAPPVERQAARKLLCSASSDALLRGGTSRALSLLREEGFDITSAAEV